MWSSTWPRPTREERDITQIDDAVSDIVMRAFASRNIVEDMSSRNIFAIVFDLEVPQESGPPFYAYRAWIDGLDETLPGLTPGGTVPGFSNSLVGTLSPFVVGDQPPSITVEELAGFLQQNFGYQPIAIRRYSVVAPQPGGAELIVAS